MSGPESNHSAWLAKAENDLLNIQNNLAATEVPWDTVCFHSQQAAEKFLKAFLVFHGPLPAKTHDLVVLLTKCLDTAPELSIVERDCRRLTYYAIGSRYPDDLYEPNERDAREMIAAANRVRQAILRHMPSQDPG